MRIALDPSPPDAAPVRHNASHNTHLYPLNEKPDRLAQPRLVVRLDNLASLKRIKPRQLSLAKAKRRACFDAAQ
jgi:hypothetical protein